MHTARNVFLLTACMVFITVLASCKSVEVKKPAEPLNKLAIVSVSVNDWGGSVSYGAVGRDSANNHIVKSLTQLLKNTEEILGQAGNIAPMTEVVNNAKYKELSVKSTLSMVTPPVNGTPMSVFSNESGDVKGGVLKPETAKALCSALKVDGVILIYSEWATAVGKMIPTTKALTKNVVTVWDKSGNMVFKKRVDRVGTKVLGVSGIKAVNETTIGEWVNAYSDALMMMKGDIAQLTK